MPKEPMNLDKASFQITLHAGNAKDLAHDALVAAKEGKFDQAKSIMEEAEQEYNDGHDIQSQTMQKDDKNERIVPTMLLSHAMDHLMAAKSEIFLIKEMIELYKR